MTVSVGEESQSLHVQGKTVWNVVAVVVVAATAAATGEKRVV